MTRELKLMKRRIARKNVTVTVASTDVSKNQGINFSKASIDLLEKGMNIQQSDQIFNK